MQQSLVCPDMASPYAFWQYVNLMAPCKTADYNIHPAFTHTNPHAIQSVACIQDQFINNVNNRLHHLPYHRQGLIQHTRDEPSAHNGHQTHTQKDYPGCNKTEIIKRLGKHHLNSSPAKRIKPKPTTTSYDDVQVLTFPSPKKKSSFTIDAILSKDESGRSLSESVPKVFSERIQTKNFSDSASICNHSGASTPPKMSSPSNIIFNFPPPLMHSTPTSFHFHASTKRNGRFLEGPHPYFIQQFDDQHDHHLHQNQTYLKHVLSSPQLTSSLSSASSSSSTSATTSASTSPESAPATRNEKSERRSAGKSKRIRTIFTPEQLERLEAEFERQQYMVGTERFYLASSLSLTEAQVKVWFQNRRIKWRKQHLEQQQARLAQGDLYRDVQEESDDSFVDEHRVTDSLTNDARQSH